MDTQVKRSIKQERRFRKQQLYKAPKRKQCSSCEHTYVARDLIQCKMRNCDQPLCTECQRNCDDHKCTKKGPFCGSCTRQDDYFIYRCLTCDNERGMH